MNNNEKYTSAEVHQFLDPMNKTIDGFAKHLGDNNNVLLRYAEIIEAQTREIKKGNLIRIMQDPINFSNDERVAARQEYNRIIESEQVQSIPSHMVL